MVRSVQSNSQHITWIGGVGYTECQLEARDALGIPRPSAAPERNWLAPLLSIVTFVCADCGATNAKPAESNRRKCAFCGSANKNRPDKPDREPVLYTGAWDVF